MIRRSEITHDNVGLPIPRGVALHGLSQVVTTLLVGFQRQYRSVKIAVRECDIGIEADVRAYVDESHAAPEVCAEECDLPGFIDSKRQRTRDDGVVWIDPDEGIPDGHRLRQQKLDRGICRSPQWG